MPGRVASSPSECLAEISAPVLRCISRSLAPGASFFDPQVLGSWRWSVWRTGAPSSLGAMSWRGHSRLVRLASQGGAGKKVGPMSQRVVEGCATVPHTRRDSGHRGRGAGRGNGPGPPGLPGRGRGQVPDHLTNRDMHPAPCTWT